MGLNLLDRARAVVTHGGTVLDVGAGIRPQTVVRADRTLCIEPYGPYAGVLRDEGYEVLQMTAEAGLASIAEEIAVGVAAPDTVVMIDVIEHMEKEQGLRVLALARSVASQVVVFTPLGFIEQTADAWGMSGDYWQTHRSGWLPEEFADCIVLVDELFHARLQRGAFFAISIVCRYLLQRWPCAIQRSIRYQPGSSDSTGFGIGASSHAFTGHWTKHRCNN